MNEKRTTTDCTVTSDGVALPGFLTLPAEGSGIVVFAHGSGSSRFSRRNNAVADKLSAAGLGTLLFDLLTPAEEERDLVTREIRFDIALLARRLIGSIDWLADRHDTGGCPLGLFGSSTGAAAALIAAAQRPRLVDAVVSRGGRVDLAVDCLHDVRAPTRLIVGGNDRDVLALNRAVLDRLPGPARLDIVTGASHLFEEPGALTQVAELARDWFVAHLGTPAEPITRRP